MKSKQKKRAWRWCAKYIKLRDALEDFPLTNDLDLVRCRTCGKWLKTKSKEAQAAHFWSRGLSGGSGVYFDERNIHICCYQCNCFRQGNAQPYREFMIRKYGQKVIDELEVKHRAGKKYKIGELEALGDMYKAMFEELRNGKIS